MLKNFFKLNSPFESFDSEKFEEQLQVSKHLCNILYSPEKLTSKKIGYVRVKCGKNNQIF